MPPIRMMGRAPGFDYDLLFEVDPGTEEVYPLRQVVFEHRLLERPRAVPIYDRMRGNPEFLMELLREWGLDRGDRSALLRRTRRSLGWAVFCRNWDTPFLQTGPSPHFPPAMTFCPLVSGACRVASV